MTRRFDVHDYVFLLLMALAAGFWIMVIFSVDMR